MREAIDNVPSEVPSGRHAKDHELERVGSSLGSVRVGHDEVVRRCYSFDGRSGGIETEEAVEGERLVVRVRCPVNDRGDELLAADGGFVLFDPAGHQRLADPGGSVSSARAVEVLVDHFVECTFFFWGFGERFQDRGWYVLGDCRHDERHRSTLRGVVFQVDLSQVWPRCLVFAQQTPEPQSQSSTVLGQVARVGTVVWTCDVTKVSVVGLGYILPQFLEHKRSLCGEELARSTILDAYGECPNVDAVVGGCVVLSEYVGACSEYLVDIRRTRVGEIDQGLVVRPGSDPAYCERPHEAWVRVGCDEVVAVGTVASHGSNSLDLKCVANLFNQIGADEVGELLDDLDELRSDELAPVWII